MLHTINAQAVENAKTLIPCTKLDSVVVNSNLETFLETGLHVQLVSYIMGNFVILLFITYFKINFSNCETRGARKSLRACEVYHAVSISFLLSPALPSSIVALR